MAAPSEQDLESVLELVPLEDGGGRQLRDAAVFERLESGWLYTDALSHCFMTATTIGCAHARAASVRIVVCQHRHASAGPVFSTTSELVSAPLAAAAACPPISRGRPPPTCWPS